MMLSAKPWTPALALLVLFSAPLAHAQDASEAPPAKAPPPTLLEGRGGDAAEVNTLAERFFVEGRVLLARGDAEGACARFEASRKLDPAAAGTLLNLGLCNVALERYATAADFFNQVVESSRGTRQDRVERASQHLKDIEAKISYLRVVVPEEAKIAGLVVRLDGVELPPNKWGVELPTDGGTRTLEATAPQKTSFRLEVPLEKVRGRGFVTVPKLADVPDTTRAGYTLATVGGVLFLVGAGLGISVASECGGLFKDTCAAANKGTQTERDDKLNELDTRAWASNIVLGAGLVSAAVGVTLVLTSPSRRSAPAKVGMTPLVSPKAAGWSLQASF